MTTPYAERNIARDQPERGRNSPFCPGAEWEKSCTLLKIASRNSLAGGGPQGTLFQEGKDLKKGSRA